MFLMRRAQGCLRSGARQTMRYVPLLGLLAGTPCLMAADDPVLREVEDEVRRQATALTLEPPQFATAKPQVADIDITGDAFPTGLDVTTFGQALRKALPGTYTLYERLKPAVKQQIYTAYQNDPRFASISAEVTRLSSGGKP